MDQYEHLRPFATDRQLRIIDVLQSGCTKAEAAKKLGISVRNVFHALRLCRNAATAKQSQKENEEDAQEVIRSLNYQLREAQREAATERSVRREIFGLSETTPTPPSWTLSTPASSSPGVPTLFLSDWHWGEVVRSEEVGGVNQFNIEIAHQRARRCIERTVYLLTKHVVSPKYPGIVVPLGGDMVTGDIHEELSVTNEQPIMPTVIDLFGVLIWCIETLADQFGHVFLPCVTGNHGRTTKKIRAKGRHHTSFDWLLYTLLDRHFQKDKRIQFCIPEGPDCFYKVFGHRYLLTHGDQFRGGDGMIGALGPILRGDHKKRSRNSAIGLEYDTMLMGHWHQLIPLKRLIVNSSLKGMDEYSYANNFPFEPPQQGLWLTHPQHGITFSMPVHLAEQRMPPQRTWVSWVS